jgi:hypothetical protein
MSRFLVVLEARSPGSSYELLLDVLQRRLGAWRILRAAWVVEAATAETVADSLVFYVPCEDGLLILPFAESRFERRLRDAQGRPPVPQAYKPVPVGDQDTPA